MPKTVKKRQENTTGGWTAAMLRMLRGAIVGAAVAIVILLAASALILGGAVKQEATNTVLILAGLLGGAIAGLTAAGQGRGGALRRGLGAGVMMILMLLSAGALIGDAAVSARLTGVVPIACLCGSGVGALLRGAGRAKNNAKKRRRAPSAREVGTGV